MQTKALETVDKAKSKMAGAISFLQNELAALRAGKASPAIFDPVKVDYYGNPTPLSQVASINVPDARTLLIQPWEKSLIKAIEKAIIDANLGFTPQNNGEHIRINIPPLTEETRKDLVKKAKASGENAKITIRNIRRDAIETLKKAQKEGMPEDLQKSTEDTIQKEVEKFNKSVDEVIAVKEKEILTV